MVKFFKKRVILVLAFIFILLILIVSNYIKLDAKVVINNGEKVINFDVTQINKESKKINIAIKNTGWKTVKIEDIFISGKSSANFIMKNVKDKVIKRGKSITLTINYKPITIGTTSASLVVKTNINKNKKYIIDLIGTSVTKLSYTLLAPKVPLPPVAVIAAFEGNKIRITWNDEPNTPAVNNYNLYIATTPHITKTNSIKIDNISKPYLYSNFEENKTLYFAVTAVNNVGESNLSEIESIRPARVFYISSINGKDSNSGLSSKYPWKSLSKVNSYKFQPGDFILFEKGTKYYGKLAIESSGIKDKPITIGAYGEGDRPLISGIGEVPNALKEANWTNEGNNIWSIYYGPWKIARRVWLSEKEYVKAEVLKDMDATYRWFFDDTTSKLYVYAPKNPAIEYTSIKESSATESVSMLLNNQDYISLNGVEFENIEINNADYITIKDCKIGNGAYMGITIVGMWNWNKENSNNKSDYGVIKGSIVDSNYNLTYYYEKSNTEDGIHMRNNVNHWKIYGNEVKNWGHTGISLWQVATNTEVSFNEVYANTMTAGDILFGRSFETKGRPGGCSYNKFYKNYVYNTYASIQIGGDYNSVYYNIVDTVKNSPVIKLKGASGIVLTPAMGTNVEYVSNHNKIMNNLIYNADVAGIDMQDWHGKSSTRYNEIINNIIVNCGHDADREMTNAGLALSDKWYINEASASDHNIIRNNLIYSKTSDVAIHYRGDLLTVGQFNDKNGSFSDIIRENYFYNPKLKSSQLGKFITTKLFIVIDNGFKDIDTTDLLGNIVPTGKTDIGPYEFGS